MLLCGENVILHYLFDVCESIRITEVTVCGRCSFLKLYTTMPVAKLAGFLDMTEQEFRIQLLVFKHKMKNLVWTSGISALDGEFQSASEVDFYIDKVGLCNQRAERSYTVYVTVGRDIKL